MSSSAINCTYLELKPFFNDIHEPCSLAINCTYLELKQIVNTSDLQKAKLSIVPIWN